MFASPARCTPDASARDGNEPAATGRSEAMQLFVREVTGASLSVAADGFDTVAALKDRGPGWDREPGDEKAKEGLQVGGVFCGRGAFSGVQRRSW